MYKQKYVVTNGDGTRIINSNVLVAERMEQLEKKLQNTHLQQPNEDGFVAGLNLEAVEVVPKEENISIEETLGKASAEAEFILENARRQAEKTLEEVEQQAQKLLEQAKEQGYHQGLQEGRKKAQEEQEVFYQQMEDERQSMQDAYRQKVEELEPQLVDVIVDVFEKVFHVQFDDKKDILIYLIQNTILGIEGTKDFQIKVGIEDFKFLGNHMNEIREQVGQAANIELMADGSMKDGQCMIETDSGVFDCGRDVQLENLIKALRSLSLKG